MGKQGEETPDEGEALDRRQWLCWSDNIGRWRPQFGRVELEACKQYCSKGSWLHRSGFCGEDMGSSVLGPRIHRSRWDYPGRGYWTHIFKSRSRGIPVSLTTSARILIFSCPRHFCFSGIQTWNGIYNIVLLLSELWRTPLVFLGQPAHRQLLMGLLSLHYHVNKYLMLNPKNQFIYLPTYLFYWFCLSG